MPVASGSIAYLGAARFQGYWNASTNTGTGSVYGGISGEKLGLFATGTSPNAGYQVETGLTASKGDYWQVTGSGTHNVDGDTNWNLNDFCIFSGSTTGAGSWKRLSYEDTVASIIVGDLSADGVFHMATGSDGHVIFASGSVFSGSGDFVYDYLTSKLSVTTVSGTTITPHTLNLGQGGLAGPAATVSASAGTFAVLSGSRAVAHSLTSVGQVAAGSVSASSGQFATLSGSTLTPHLITLGPGGLAGLAATVSSSVGTFATLSGSTVSVHTLSSPAGTISASAGTFATLSGSTVTPHLITLGPGGLAGLAATVSSSAGTFATLSGSVATVNSLTLGNTAITSDAGEINLLDGAAAGTIAAGKTVVYSSLGFVTGSQVLAFGVTGSGIVSGNILQGHALDIGAGDVTFDGGVISLDKAAGGDSIIGFLVGGNEKWSAGVDQSDSHKFKLRYDTGAIQLADGSTFELDSTGNLVLLGGVSTAGGTVSASAGTFATLSGSAVTPHLISLGPGGLAGPAATVSSSAGTFATLSGSAVSAHTLAVNTFAPATVSASSGQFATLSGSAVTVNSLSLGNTAITSDAGEINLLDGSSAGALASSKAVIYSAADIVTGSAFVGFRATVSELGNTTANQLTASQGAKVVDNLPLYFGTDQDSYIRYDEDGQDFLTISGSSAGTVMSGSVVRVVDKLSIGEDMTSTKASGILMVNAHADDTTNGLIATFKSGDSDYCRVNIDNSTANGDTQFTFMSNGSSKWSVGNMGSNETLHIKSGFGDFADGDPFVLTTTALTLNTSLTASSGGLIPDDKRLYFGDSGEGHIAYDETLHDFLTISGSHAGGIALSGSKLMFDVDAVPNLVASGSRGGPGSYLALAANGQVVLSTPDGGGGGAISSVGNGADNRIATFSDSDALNGEANLTFNGSTLTLAGVMTGSSYSGFNTTTTEGNFVTVSGSAATLHNITLNNVAITSDAGEINLLDGASAGTLASSKAVIYSSADVVTGSAFVGFRATVSELGNTTANFFTASQGAKFADDKKVYFGDSQESHIRYDEAGMDFLTISGSHAGGIVLSGSKLMLDINGAPDIVASGSRGGPGSYLAMAANGQVVLSTPDGGGAISSVGNGADNRIATFSDSDALNGEANLTFNGSTLTLAGVMTGSSYSGFNITTTEGIFTNSTVGIATGSSFTGFTANATEVIGNSVSASSGQFATLSGSAATLHSITLGNTAITSDAGEINLLDGSGAGSIANSKAVIYSAAGVVTASNVLAFGVQATQANIGIATGSSLAAFRLSSTEGIFGSTTVGIATGSSFTGFRGNLTEATVATTLSASATSFDNVAFQKVTSNSNQTTGMAMAVTASSLTYGSAVQLYSSGSANEPRSLLKIQNQHLAATASVGLWVYQSSMGPASVIRGAQVRNVGEYGFSQITHTNGQTIGPRAIVDGIYFALARGSGKTDTMAPASQIVPMISHPYDVNMRDTVTFRYYNAGANTVTLAGGVNVLNAFGNATASFNIAANQGRVFAISVADTNPASYKVYVTPLSDAFNITT